MAKHFWGKFLAVLSLCLLAGCAAEKDTDALPDNYDYNRPDSLLTNNVIVRPVVKQLTPADKLAIERLVFVYLLQRHFGDGGDYSAVFLQADDSEVAMLMKQFPDHNPPIKQSYRALLPANRAPLDKDTGRPAMILSVDVGELNDDDSVDVLGKWYAGGAVSGFYTFLFKQTDGVWTIASVK